jgi:hypothetical protein
MKTEQPIQPPVAASAVIPPITDPMGKYWGQPSLDRITLNETHAFMDAEAFDELRDYSCSQPTGVYPGKMWKHSNAYYRKTEKGEPLRWWLRWYGEAREPEMIGKMCSNHAREIIVSP